MINLSEWLNKISSSSLLTDQNRDQFIKIISQTGWAEKKCPVITITGTNGKGSCAAIIEAIFLAAGYRVGTFTSPHLHHYNERIRINGVSVDNESLSQVISKTEKICGENTLTFFQYTTLIAFQLFQQACLDILILEVGIGGRLDPVNLMDPDVAVITMIDIDHVERLGHTREAIGFEKSGIFRLHKPVICGDPDPPHSVIAQAMSLQTPFYKLNRDFFYKDKGKIWEWESSFRHWDSLPSPSLALQNAATALKVIELFLDQFVITREAIEKGLQEVFLPARCQVISSFPLHIVDVAHNPAAATLLSKQLEKYPCTGRTLGIWAMLSDKDPLGTAKPLFEKVDEWLVADLPGVRGGSGQRLEKILRDHNIHCVKPYKTVRSAYQAALAVAHKNDRIVSFGSFSVAAEILRA